jgi:hypothetical protein
MAQVPASRKSCVETPVMPKKGVCVYGVIREPNRKREWTLAGKMTNVY